MTRKIRSYNVRRGALRHPRMLNKKTSAQALINAKRISREDADKILAQHDRPRTRADCIDAERPCPWAGCRHHLWLDVKRDRDGDETIIVNGYCDIEDMPDTCALDCAERGGMTLEAVGATLGVTRERVRQIELRAIDKLRDIITKESILWVLTNSD